MAKEDDVLNKCGHRNSERIEALKKFPSAVCPACLFKRIKELEDVCKEAARLCGESCAWKSAQVLLEQALEG